MPPDLPPDLRPRSTSSPQGKSRREIAQRADAISRRYRAGGGSREAIRNSDDALAYAFTRLPATYAATAAALAAVARRVAGILAALADRCGRRSRHRRLGGGRAVRRARRHPADRRQSASARAGARLPAGELRARRSATRPTIRATSCAIARSGRADLVIASYVIGELAPDRLPRLADALWSAAAGMLLVVEPGTPAGFARIRALRAHLIAQGAHVVAPCPHDRACPIVDPDWCHFSQRLNRSRAHRQVKGADLSYEDEKFSYVALARERAAADSAPACWRIRASARPRSAPSCARPRESSPRPPPGASRSATRRRRPGAGAMLWIGRARR